MVVFPRVVIIFNPNSTGDSPGLAKAFAAELRRTLPDLPIDLKKTARAGHAEELAYQAACKTPDVLIVSVSGDGGYHEVVNGAMRAIDEGKGRPLCAVLPGGNANDHYSSIAQRPLVEAIRSKGVEYMDLLAVDIEGTLYYAHSYVGLGITPLVAVELNQHTLSAFKEIWLAFKAFWRLRPFEIEMHGRRHSFDSLVLANIPKMAKYLKLAKDSQPNDGRFEIIAWPHSQKMRLVGILARSLLDHGPAAKKTKQVTFTCLKPMPMQLDGEVLHLESGTRVTVTVQHGKLRTVR